MAAAPTRWTDDRLDDQADRLGRFEANVDRRFDRVDQRFERVDERFDKVDERFERFEADVDRRFDKVDERFDRFEAEVKTGFAAAAAESKASIAKLESKSDITNRTLWGGILVGLIVKFVFG